MRFFRTPKHRRQAGDAHALIMLVFVAVAASGGSYVVFRAHEKAQQNQAVQDQSAGSSTTNTTPKTTKETETVTAATGLAATAAAQKSCGYTVPTTEGPYYVSGTAALADGELNYGKLDGTPVKVGGYVYGSEDNSTPLANAKVEIWQADDKGAYHPSANGTASSFTKEQLSLRGYVTTNDTGYYEFTSILPGEYDNRPRHIYVKAGADSYQSVTSQIIVYQAGDKTPPTQDSIAKSLPQKCAWLSFKAADNSGVKADVYNIHLRKGQ